MRVPLSWLREYVEFDLSPRALADELTMRGMEVGAIETAGADWTDVVVGRVLEVGRHPNADTLWLTRVDAGDGEPLGIVCGAQNLEVGQLVPVARVGATLPGGRRIERSKIRGEVSHGMLCSAAELELGTDADGILILGRGDELALGTPLAEVVGEVVLDVDVKPNRGDALSMVGLAREVAAFTGGELRLPDASVAESDESTAAHVGVEINAPELNPRFAARWFDGVRNGPSPDWMQRRLVAAGMRPISAVVDVTNYVMHELGQPQHAYDADRVPNGRIVVRRARDGEELVTIDHVERRLDERVLVIADEARAIGLAGIMGGASTEVDDATTSVILESAVFHGPTIRNAARRLGLRSEASMRHEKGIGHDLPRFAADRAAHLLAEITGARVGRGIVDNDPEPKPRLRVEVDPGRVGRLLGIPVEPQRVAELLRPLGFEVEPAADGTVVVGVPPHRLDVTEAADVAEEIARAHGYERIPGRLPQAALPPYRPDPTAERHTIRRILAGLGIDEVVSHALIGPDDLVRVGRSADAADVVRIYNPLSPEHSVLRTTMTPSLLGAAAENARWRTPDVRLFELGKVYWHHPGALTPREKRSETAGTGRYEAWELGIILVGAVPVGPGEPARDADVDDLKGIVEALHAALGAPLPTYRPEEPNEGHRHRHPGRTALVCDDAGRPYGSIGEVHPDVADAWGLAGRPVDATLAVGRLLELVPESTAAVAVSAAQPVDRDLAVVVSEATPLGDVLRVARTTGGPLLARVRLFDVYRGPQVRDDRVSYALALRFQPKEPGETAAVEKAVNRIRGALRHHLGAEIR